jgi:uncharacterized GH25 family protein
MFTLALLAALAAPAVAHEYWLAPARYDAPPGESVIVRAFAGTGFRGELKPWAPERCVRLVARAARLTDLARGAAPGAERWTRFATADSGGAMLAFESSFTPIELAADAFDAYLAEEGLTGPAAARRASPSRAPVRERYRRCAKAWLAGSDAARATTPIGLPLELVPLALPGGEPALRVRLLAEGRPLAGALVRSWRAPLDAAGYPRDPATRDSSAVAWEARTNARGEATVPCAEPGEWLVATVDMRRSREPGAAEWESTWASLTFARPGGAREPR